MYKTNGAVVCRGGLERWPNNLEIAGSISATTDQFALGMTVKFNIPARLFLA